MKKTTQQIKLIALGIIVAAGASYAFAWTGPTLPPPGGNVSSPINTGTTTQIKAGNLVMNGLSVNAATVLSGVVQLAVGTPAQGDILVASDTSGTVKWKAPAQNFDGVYMENLQQNGTMYSTGGCRWANPATGSCSCPPGYTSYQFFDFNIGGNQGAYTDGGTHYGSVAMYQCYD